jgi:hypothetical protein
VNQTGGLKSVPAALFTQMAMRLPVQLIINKFEQCVGRVVVPIAAPITQPFCYAAFRIPLCGHVNT